MRVRYAACLAACLLALSGLLAPLARADAAGWPSFRGNACNNAVTQAATPERPETAALLWSRSFSGGWGAAPSAQIVVDGALVVMSGTTLMKLDCATGATLATAAMCTSADWGYTPPAYGDGMIFAPLGGSRIQAFDAATLAPLWTYTGAGGQSLCPITYADGRIYTGFWRGSAESAEFVCIDVRDEDPSRGDEAKTARWSFAAAGGFYWTAALVAGGTVVFGGNAAGGADARLYARDAASGAARSELALPGNQRSGIVYDADSGRVFFTVSTGLLCSAVLDADGGGLSDLRTGRIGASSTSTPVVYGDRVYAGAGDGGGAGALAVCDAASLERVFSVATAGNVQCSPLLSAAHRASGAVCLYLTCNRAPGGLSLVRVKADAATAEDAELTELYDAHGHEQYCISSPVCDEDGRIFYKNDSCTVFAVGAADDARLRAATAAIAALGATKPSEQGVADARSAYDTLPAALKAQVVNYSTLLAAEQALSTPAGTVPAPAGPSTARGASGASGTAGAAAKRAAGAGADDAADAGATRASLCSVSASVRAARSAGPASGGERARSEAPAGGSAAVPVQDADDARDTRGPDWTWALVAAAAACGLVAFGVARARMGAATGDDAPSGDGKRP